MVGCLLESLIILAACASGDSVERPHDSAMTVDPLKINIYHASDPRPPRDTPFLSIRMGPGGHLHQCLILSWVTDSMLAVILADESALAIIVEDGEQTKQETVRAVLRKLKRLATPKHPVQIYLNIPDDWDAKVVAAIMRDL
jgi:hypothetical protein